MRRGGRLAVGVLLRGIGVLLSCVWVWLRGIGILRSPVASLVPTIAALLRLSVTTRAVTPLVVGVLLSAVTVRAGLVFQFHRSGFQTGASVEKSSCRAAITNPYCCDIVSKLDLKERI